MLRDGLERILRGRTGAIIVLGYDEMVESISSGGFNLDVELSAARLRELAKMDGAVVVDRTAGIIRTFLKNRLMIILDNQSQTMKNILKNQKKIIKNLKPMLMVLFKRNLKEEKKEIDLNLSQNLF